MPKHYCASCGDIVIPAYGSPNAEAMILGPYPGAEEMKCLRPFAGNTGRVIRIELWKVGLDLLDFRVLNIWPHLPNKNENCFNYGRELAIEEGRKKRAVLLIGSDTLQTFTDYKVSDVNGLIISSPYFGAELIMASVNPASVFKENRGVGEFRFAVQQFAQELEERGIR